MAKQKVNDIAKAQETLANLQQKQAELSAHAQADERTLESIAFAAHTGDAKASAALETLKDRAMRRDLETKAISSAIMEARRRVAEATNAEREAEQEKVNAEIAE